MGWRRQRPTVAVGGAWTNGNNTNGPLYPGYPAELQAFLNSGRTFGRTDLVFIEEGGKDALGVVFGGPEVTVAAATAAGVTSGNIIAASVGTLIGKGARNFEIMT